MRNWNANWMRAIPIFVVVVFFTVAGTAVTTLALLNGCGNCGKCANCGCAAAFQYSVVTGLVVTSSLLFDLETHKQLQFRPKQTSTHTHTHTKNAIENRKMEFFVYFFCSNSCYTWSLLAIHRLSRFLRLDSGKIRIRLRFHLPIYSEMRRKCWWLFPKNV